MSCQCGRVSVRGRCWRVRRDVVGRADGRSGRRRPVRQRRAPKRRAPAVRAAARIVRCRDGREQRMRAEEVAIAALGQCRCVMARLPLLPDGRRRARAELGDRFPRLTRCQDLAHRRQADDQPHGEQGEPCGQALAGGGGQVHPRMVTQFYRPKFVNGRGREVSGLGGAVLRAA